MTIELERPVEGLATGGGTTVHGIDPLASDDRPRTPARATADDRLCLWGSLAGSLAMVWILWTQVLPTEGAIGFVLVWFAAYVVLFALVTSLSNPMPVVLDRVAGSLVRGGALIVAAALLSAVWFTFDKGHDALFHWNFVSSDLAGVRPTDALTKGGVLHAIIGSGIQIGIAVVIALPLGIGAAVYMVEVGGAFARVVRTVVEAMTALPSVVAGLFIYTTFILGLGLQRSGLAAGLAITVMMLPIIARSADVVLRVVPGGLRDAALALGAPTWRVVWHVVLPTARSGLATALILGIARGVGETSPVLLTSGESTFSNHDPFHKPMISLPLFIFQSVRSGEPTFIARGFGAASLLLALVLVLFVITRLLARQPASR